MAKREKRPDAPNERPAATDCDARQSGRDARSRAQAHFISMISHDLRTPLHTLNGFLDIVLDGQAGPLNERQTEFLGYARQSAQQLTSLVEDILFISRAESGQFTLRLRAVNVYVALEQTCLALRGLAEQLRVTLRIATPENLPPLHADELRLLQTLSNLTHNAITFSPAGGVVTLSALQDGDMLRLSVADEGKGIPLDEQELIFERFYQSESSARARAGGYGLGLATAKLIVEQHHGAIGVVSAPGHGATFWFTLPLTSAQSDTSISTDDQANARDA